jgi:hypothetical protein
MGVILLNDYQEKLPRTGVIINIIVVNNITYTLPIYRVKQNETVYYMYDRCIFNNYQNCSHYDSNTIIYYEKINGFYIVSEMNFISFYFAVFAFTFSIGMLICVTFAYYDFYRMKRKESKINIKSKKHDLFIEDDEYPSTLLFD